MLLFIFFCLSYLFFLNYNVKDWYLICRRQRLIIWASFIIRIWLSLLGIAWKGKIGFWCMSSCLKGAWRIISLEVSSAIHIWYARLDTFLFPFNFIDIKTQKSLV